VAEATGVESKPFQTQFMAGIIIFRPKASRGNQNPPVAEIHDSVNRFRDLHLMKKAGSLSTCRDQHFID
jgi:hypothetical protein